MAENQPNDTAGPSTNGPAATPTHYETCGQARQVDNPQCDEPRHSSSIRSSTDSITGRKPPSVRQTSSVKVPSVRSLPGGEMRNRHRGPNPFNRPPSVNEEPGRELPMQYSFPVRTPVAGKYKPPQPWKHKMKKWEWWKPHLKYWGTCQGCFEDQGCFAPDGACAAIEWKCCLSCWLPCWFGGPNHRFMGWCPF